MLVMVLALMFTDNMLLSMHMLQRGFSPLLPSAAAMYTRSSFHHQLLFIKLGGSAITNQQREGVERPEVIRHLARQIKQASEENPDLKIVIGHGTGSFGHFVAKRTGFGQPDNWSAYVATAASTARLHRIVSDILLEEGLNVVSVMPSATAFLPSEERKRCLINSVEACLEKKGLIPLVYGDVALDDVKGMSVVSTEDLFTILMPRLQPHRIILALSVSGIFDCDPVQNSDARLITHITPESFEKIQQGISDSPADFVGGMHTTVQEMIDLVSRNPKTQVIILGARDGESLKEVLLGQQSRGTLIYNPFPFLS